VAERQTLPEHYRVKALEQALGVLDLLADDPDLALPEIAQRLGLQTPNAHKLILHLQEAGLVETGAISKRYRLGAARLGELTAKALSETSPWEALRASVPALHEATGLPGLIAVLAGGRAVYVEQFRGPARALGRAFPAHATALGKALLTEAPEAVLDELVLDPWTERTIVDAKALAKELAVVRRRGWAIEDGELDVARRSVGAVVRDHRGTAVAAIGVGGFARGLPDKRLKEVAGLVVAEAWRVSQALGGGALAELGPPRLEVELLGAVEASVPPPPRGEADDEQEARRISRGRAGG